VVEQAEPARLDNCRKRYRSACEEYACTTSLLTDLIKLNKPFILTYSTVAQW